MRPPRHRYQSSNYEPGDYRELPPDVGAMHAELRADIAVVIRSIGDARIRRFMQLRYGLSSDKHGQSLSWTEARAAMNITYNRARRLESRGHYLLNVHGRASRLARHAHLIG